MPGFRKVRDVLLLAYCTGIIDDTEFCLLYDCNSSRNPDFPYWQYDRFDLDRLEEAECKAEFRFYKNDIYSLAEILRIPEEITCYNRTKVDQIEALAIFLKRFAYPCRYGDIIPRFGRSVPEMSIISSYVVDWIYDHYKNKLTDFMQNWLRPEKLQEYADAIHRRGAALDCCWGFVDGTVRPLCRPGQQQRLFYNGHKRVHSLKFQSVVAPNGLIANLYGPIEGRRHDCALLAASGLLEKLHQNSYSPTGQMLCIYGDPAYPLRPQLMSPFRGRLTPDQAAFNKSMSTVRVSVEWIFGDIVNYFAFLDFKKNLKIGLSPVGKMYIICALLHNARTCLYKNTSSAFFGIDPPSIDLYFE